MCMPEYLYALILFDSLASKPREDAPSPVASPMDRSSRRRWTSMRPEEGPLITLPDIGCLAPVGA
jgi:hypothetical protein